MSRRHFRVLSVLGTGGFGLVLRARQEGPDGFRAEVALKLLREDVARDEEKAARLRDEARLLGCLRHPTLVAARDLVTLDVGQAIVMDLVEGPNLSAVLDTREPLSIPAALAIVATVADALDYAWSAPGPDGGPLRLLHRDIKPANLAVSRHGEVKLLDLGVARAEHAGREALTCSEVRGTPQYMAPERMLHQDTPAVDVFALGLVLFNLLSCYTLESIGAKPEELAAHLDEIRADLAGRYGEDNPCFEPLFELIRSCMAWEPAARPSPAELSARARALLAVSEGERLHTWAARAIPPLMASPPRFPESAPWVGRVLRERPEGLSPARALSVSGASLAWAGAAISLTVLSVLVGMWAGSRLALERASSWDQPALTSAVDDGQGAGQAATGGEVEAWTPPGDDVEPARAPEHLSGSTTSHRAPPSAPAPVPVSLAGDALSVALEAGGALFPLPGDVSPGTYTIRARFPGYEQAFAAGEVRVGADGSMRVHCRSDVEMCRGEGGG